MHTDLILICHGSTAATRSASFPADEPLEPAVEPPADAAVRTITPGLADRALRAPSVAAGQTAAALGLDAVVEPALQDCRFGRWSGRRLVDVARDEPGAFAAWMTDPSSSPPGGESVAALLARLGAWVDSCRETPGRTIAVTHSAVIRAAVIHAIEATPATFWHLDVGPMSETWLRGNGSRWALRGLRA